MVASVFRHFDTGPLRGKVQCQAAWSNVLYINNFIWDYAPTIREAQEKYGGGVSLGYNYHKYFSISKNYFEF